MNSSGIHSPLISKYTDILERDPSSRVFAPLAEIYKKFGMHDKALAILKAGLKNSPDYTLGYICLSGCYIDVKQYQLAYSTLAPLAPSNRDNIKLQRMFGEVCVHLSHIEEALDTYKYLLFLNPKDKEAAKKVSELEVFFKNNLLEDSTGPASQFDIDGLNNGSESTDNCIDDWIQVDLKNENDREVQWQQETILAKEESKMEVAIEIPDAVNIEAAPVITHTLVNLYCSQGHIEKAEEVLVKMLALNPADIKTKNKLIEIRSLMDIDKKNVTDEGRASLMNYFDQKISQQQETTDLVEDKLWQFYDAICKRSEVRKT